MNWNDFVNMSSDEDYNQFFKFLQKKFMHSFLTKKINRSDAEDFTQELCVRVNEHIDTISKFSDSYHIKCYIYKIAKNILKDYYRGYFYSLQQQKNVNITEIVNTIIANSKSAEDIINNEEMIEVLYHCIEEINPKWAEMLVWSVVDEKTAGEIAEEYGIPTRTQRLWKQKAYRDLKICMENNIDSQ